MHMTPRTWSELHAGLHAIPADSFRDLLDGGHQAVIEIVKEREHRHLADAEPFRCHGSEFIRRRHVQQHVGVEQPFNNLPDLRPAVARELFAIGGFRARQQDSKKKRNLLGR